jgi:integrase/recombinase XerD
MQKPHDLVPANPMAKLEPVQRDTPQSRALRRDAIEKILARIPPNQSRNRLLFRLLFETGLRISEALALYVEDLDLALGNEHMTVQGKGSMRRTILLDDSKLVAQLRATRNSPMRQPTLNYAPGGDKKETLE